MNTVIKYFLVWITIIIASPHCKAKKFRRQYAATSTAAGGTITGADGGYQYNGPIDGGTMTMTALMMVNQPQPQTITVNAGQQQQPIEIGGGNSGYHSAPAVEVSHAGNNAGPDMEGLAGLAELAKLGVQESISADNAIKNDGGSSITTNVETTASVSFSGADSTDHLSNFGTGVGDLLGGTIGSSGSSDQFTALEGEVINEKPPSIFEYKPRFGGKDINNLPHILPPGKKSVHELQEEADAKLRSIIAKARENQNSAIERINKLRQNYGYGTFGFDGFTDTRFKINGNIDLGTHRGIDLGTSIDYTRLKGSNGKLKLPVQNIYHTKTLGIRIPQPYPVKHEVAVPHAIPVPHPIPVPQHHPTPYTPLDNENVIHLTADSLNQSPFSYGGGGGSGFGSERFVHFGGDEPSHSFKGVSSSTFSIEPSQTLGSSSTSSSDGYGPPQFQSGQPIAGLPSNTGETPVEMEMPMLTVSTFGLPPGSQSGALSSYNPPNPPVRPPQEYGVPDNAAGSSEGHEVKSEAEMMSVISMKIPESIRRADDQRRLENVPLIGHKFLRLRPKLIKSRN